MSDQDSKVVQVIQGDLLYGVPAIAEFLGITERQARHRVATNQFPSFNIGKTICSRKSTLIAAIDRMENEPRPAPASVPDPEAA